MPSVSLDTIVEKIEELREATRQANEALKDLKAERKAVATMIVEATNDVSRIMGEAAAKELKELGDCTARAIDECEQRIFKRFDKFAEALMDKESAPGNIEARVIQALKGH